MKVDSEWSRLGHWNPVNEVVSHGGKEEDSLPLLLSTLLSDSKYVWEFRHRLDLG